VPARVRNDQPGTWPERLSRSIGDMRLFFSLLVLAVLIGPAPAICAAEPKSGGNENVITMNFENVDISVVAKFISRITGKSFVLDQSVSGKVSIIAPTRVTPMQAYCIFESALQVKGFATVGAGRVIKILPSRDARTWAALTRSQAPAGQCAQAIPSNSTTTAVHGAAAARPILPTSTGPD
jgi:type II secretory pathway component GspD/PulD (secretin)